MSKDVVSPYYLTVYDDTGRQVFDCAGSSTCKGGATFTAWTPNNATRTYTAYVALDRPMTGPPVNDVRGASSVSVANLGWTGTLELSADRTDVDANNAATVFTVTPSMDVVSPYYLTVYDDTGRQVFDCAGSSTCKGGATFTAWTPNNATRTYTAYVALDRPMTGPPVNDVRSPVAVTVGNLGWTGSTTLTADSPYADANDASTTFTVAVSKDVVSPYYLTVYDDTGRQVFDCAGSSTCKGGATFTAWTPNNATRTYTAYVALDRPMTGPPVNDVRGASSVSVANLGWTGTLELSADRTDVDANNAATVFTVTPSMDVVSPYYLTVYDDTGRQVFDCAGSSTCKGGATFTAWTPNNATRTYTAYVALDRPMTGPPVNDVRSPVAVTVGNLGWTGSTTLTADSPYADANDASTTFTVAVSKDVVSPYYLTVYDDTGRQVFDCAGSSTCKGGATFTAWTPNNATRTYTAYVALDRPMTGPPVNDVRGASSVSVANLGWTGTLELSADRTDVDANNAATVFTVTPSMDVVSPYYLTVYDDTGRQVFDCAGSSTCKGGATFTAWTPNNATRTYTAYVALDRPMTGPPVNDVRSPVAVTVRNHGWTGSVALLQRQSSPTSRTMTVTPSKDVVSPYYLTVYDDTGRQVFDCAGSSTCKGGATFTAWTPSNATRTYTAYVAQDRPMTGPPINDVRAISGVYSTAGRGPTESGETAAGYNLSQACNDRCAGDPVNTTTGEFFETTTDLAVPGSGPGLAFTRSYGVSRTDVAGTLGRGWTDSFAMRLSIRVGAVGNSLETASQVQVTQENGSVITFSRLWNGTYVGPDRTFASLVRDTDGTYVLTRNGQQRFTFDAQGRLATLADANNNTVTLSYDGDQLAAAADDKGRSLQLTWSEDRIASVTDQTGRSVTYTYSAAGDLTRVVGPDGSVKVYSYDTAHRVVSMIHPDGGITRNDYDVASRVIKQTDPLGRVLTFAYGDGQTTITEPTGSVGIERYVDGQVLSRTTAAGTDLEATTFFTYGATNQVESTTDPLGRVVRFTHDARGNRTSVTDPLGRISTTTFDQWNNPLTVTNAAGETTSFAYDEHGNLTGSTGPDGAVSTMTVNPDGTIATATDPLGRVTSFAYDTNGYLATVTGPDGAALVTQFDELGRVVATTDPRGTAPGASPAEYTTTFSYDAAGRRTSGTDPLGAVVATAYDAAGRPTTVTDALGAQSLREYDAAGQLVAVVDAAGGRTTMTYDGAGRMLTVTDALGATTSTEYDALGRAVGLTDALGRISRTEYDAGDRVVATVAPSGARTTYTYDVADQLLTVADPLGGQTVTTYDPAGRPVTVTDADGRAVTGTYDDAGRPVALERADGSTVAWAYDASGQITAYTDAAGTPTTYTYDTAGRRATSTDAAGRTTAYAYDRAGLLATVTYPDAQHASYSYDAAGQVVGIDYSDTTPDVTYTYDAAGRATAVTDGTGQTDYSYDVLGQVLDVTRGATTVGYGWDNVGQLTDLTYPSGQSVQRTYDAAGQLTTLTDWADRVFTYTWTDDGQVDQLTYPNGVTTDYEQDATGQVLGITTSNDTGIDLLELAYSYTDAGLMADQTTTRSTEARAPPTATTSTSTFTWDPLARIAQISGDQAGTFTFDTTGSLTALADGRTLTYDPAGQVTGLTNPTAITVTAFGYDGRGNRTTTATTGVAGTATTTAAYDLANRLTSLTSPDGVTTSYTYNAAGLRASATTGTGPDAVEDFTWDSAAPIPLLLADARFTYLYGAGTAPLAQVALDDGHVEYLHTDLIGSIRTTTDTNGQVTADANYDTYGQPLTITNSPVSDVTRFGYAGEYTDPTGYIYLRNRYYDPTTAQFLTRDPLEDRTLDPYGYTSGNPLQFIDPLGLFSWNPLDWDPDVLDTVSAIAGGAAAILVVTGVGAPVAAVLGGVAMATSAVATVNRVRQGDDFIDIALSGVGAVTGAGGLAARAVAKGSVAAARAASAYTRGAGSAGRAVDDVLETFDVLGYTPLTFLDGARALWCEGVI
ncbi:RHS repeat-associated core domain-containing protein [Cellulomonas sp. KRMCY2]|uniref:RHS repeat-associated core domain-containing protein n=1 Tax=Cellulomonas sp. KRMCY2 TaxID=1304865 RepID=UPI0018CC3D93|nr:RHS repeat-associated core domain-containing protein [Cellulomonas sp. KRMCY2]